MIYFTSDTHFGSERTLNYSKRPFKNIFEMDTTLVNNWNNIITNNDRVFHLGDFGDFNMLKYLNGNITFIYGNYERDNKSLDLSKYISDKFNIKYLNKTDEFLLKINRDNNSYIFELVHEPSWAKTNNFVLFGHIHEKSIMKINGLNVGVDCHQFKPIELEDVLFYKNAILNHYDSEVWEPKCGS